MIESLVLKNIINYHQMAFTKKKEREKLEILGGNFLEKRKNNHSMLLGFILNKILNSLSHKRHLLIPNF